ncbi:MAG: glycosyltransferase family 2 protein [Gemmatimonadales bacterium]|nr:glycosyltransferase family 2 protein [Gemmatimonadales bacterium]
MSVVILNYNGGDLLLPTVASAFETSPGLTREVILVDNASTDGSQARAVAAFPALRVHQKPVNEGFGRANNEGMLLGRGRFLLVLNNDAVLAADALQRMVDALRDDAGAAMAGPRVMNGEGNLQVTFGPLPSVRGYLPSARQALADRIDRAPDPAVRAEASRAFIARYGYAERREVENLCGVCMLVRRDAAVQVGLFDERFTFYYEDMEWSGRARRAGWRVLHVGDAVVHHAWRPLGTKRTSRQMALARRFSQGLYFRAWGGGALFALTLGRLALAAALGRAGTGGAVSAREELDAFRAGAAAASEPPRIPRPAPLDVPGD